MTNVGIRLPGEKGVQGKSAYASALLGGYTGGEAQFYSDLGSISYLATVLEALL